MLVRLRSPFSSSHSRSEHQNEAQRARADARALRAATANRHALPEALPCTNALVYYPELRCPWGNVVVTSMQQLLPLLGDATPATAQDVLDNGYGIIFTTTQISKGKPTSCTTYYKIRRSDDEVYGRAAYLPRSCAELRRSEKTLVPAVESGTSSFSLTERESDAASESSVELPSRLVSSSLRCTARRA